MIKNMSRSSIQNIRYVLKLRYEVINNLTLLCKILITGRFFPTDREF